MLNRFKKSINNIKDIIIAICELNVTYYILFFFILPLAGVYVCLSGFPIVGLLVFLLGIGVGICFNVFID